MCQAPLEPTATRCETCETVFDLLCPRCETPLAADAGFCSACGLAFVEEAEAEAAEVGAELLAEETRVCPSCSEVIYLPDGFCRECGQELCPGCGEAIAEEDDICRSCGLILYFACPLCAFELMAGTEICPNCHALFPNFCTGCGERVDPMDERCAACGRPISRDARPGARVVQTLRIGEEQRQVLACPACDEHFPPAISDCPRCGTRICPRCQVTLGQADNVCPLCGLEPEAARSVVERDDERRATGPRCPICATPVPAGSDQCPQCEQILCPQCLAAIGEADIACPECGATFEYVCPECDTLVGPAEVHCPHCGLAF